MVLTPARRPPLVTMGRTSVPHAAQPQPRDHARPQLDARQRARVSFARRDLNEARAADLADMSPAALILMIERLRGGLDDMLRLIDETHQ